MVRQDPLDCPEREPANQILPLREKRHRRGGPAGLDQEHNILMCKGKSLPDDVANQRNFKQVRHLAVILKALSTSSSTEIVDNPLWMKTTDPPDPAAGLDLRGL